MFPTDAPSLDDYDLARLFPTEGRTAFGRWVKAGALKPGDRVSTRGSVEGANDNEALILRSIERDDADQRVYNFAVQSLPGEVTHNYLVGEGEWWTHNDSGRRFGPVTFYGPSKRNGGRLGGIRYGGPSGSSRNLIRIDRSPVPPRDCAYRGPVLHVHLGSNPKHFVLNPFRWKR